MQSPDTGKGMVADARRGNWLDRFGPQRVILGFLALAVLGVMAFAVAGQFATLLAARVLTQEHRIYPRAVAALLSNK